MLGFIIRKVIGTKNDRQVKRLWPLVAQINQIEASFASLSDEALRQKTTDWKAQLAAITDPKAIEAALQQILPEAFAVVKAACRRLCGREIEVRGHKIVWDMIPFDVQLIGGYALHNGMIFLSVYYHDAYTIPG